MTPDQITDENYMSAALFLLCKELEKRDKFKEWSAGTYHPSEDPTFPSELLKSPTAQSLREYVSRYG